MQNLGVITEDLHQITAIDIADLTKANCHAIQPGSTAEEGNHQIIGISEHWSQKFKISFERLFIRINAAEMR